MANTTFYSTSVTLSTTFVTLASLLDDQFSFITQDAEAMTAGFIRNQDTSITIYVASGYTSIPTGSLCPVIPGGKINFGAGTNFNEIWVKSASGTPVITVGIGDADYSITQLSGISTVSGTTDQVPKFDASDNLVDSTISDDGTTVTVGTDMSVTGTIVSDDATTPGLTIESGNTNTGFIDMKGKTSGKIRVTTADATAQTVTVTAAAQTVGSTTLTIPDQANVSSNFVFDTLAQTLTNKTLTSPVIATIASDLSVTGTVESADATTPILSTATGKTNTGYLSLTGKTSGSLKVLPADAMAQIVTIAPAAQTSGASTLTIPDQAGVSSDFVFTTLAQTLTNKTLTATGLITTAAGTTSLANINTPSGTLQTTAAAGDHEFDGSSSYITNEATAGRGAVFADQRFRLTSTGSTISTIANFFGANSNPVLVSGAHYEIEIEAWFLNTTSGTVVWTLTNSAAPTGQNIYYEMSPATGIVAPPGDAGMLVGQIYNDATAAKALTATAALTDAVNHYMYMKIYLINSTGTSLKIQATKSAGTITPGIGSRWSCRRVPTASVGLFAA
mgnify:CR=1 FL=1